MSPLFSSFAKINLHLEVVARRPDGYHELRTLYQTVELHDLVGVELASSGVELELRGGGAPTGGRNLAVRAAHRYLERWGEGAGVRLTLEKRIPAGGGLGGGSSDAATVLLALQGLLGTPASGYELWCLARELGADVPFFLVGGTALGIGRGDEILPLPDLGPRELWLVTPPGAVPTAQVFAALGDLTPRSLPSSIWALLQREGADVDPWAEGRNDLQDIVLQDFPAAREVYHVLLEAGASPARLSGSGGSFFALFPAPGAVEDLEASLPSGSVVVRTRTLPRAALASSRMVR